MNICCEDCNEAAKKGHLKCLQYAREKGCPWDENTCAIAAMNGHLGCLQYAHENGCPWDEQTCLLAAERFCLDCLGYAWSHMCPCPSVVKVMLMQTDEWKQAN